jgi:hypothetical protein
VTPDVDQQHICHSQSKQCALPLKVGVILSTLTPIGAFQVQDEGAHLINLWGLGQPHTLGGLLPARHGIHLLEVGAELQADSRSQATRHTTR